MLAIRAARTPLRDLACDVIEQSVAFMRERRALRASAG
jgi:hypothetical protein